MNTDEKILLEDGLARLLNVITLLYDPDYVWDDIKNETTIAARDIRLVLDKTVVVDNGDVFDAPSYGVDLGSPNGDETVVVAIERDGEKFKVTQLLDEDIFDTLLDMESE